MKRFILYTVITITGLITFTSCEDFLETQSKSTYTPDIVFSNTAYTKNALMGIYSLMTTDQMYSIRLNMYYAVNSDIEIVAFGSGNYGDNGRRGIGNYLVTPGNSELERPWNTLYQAIERANICIEEIPKSPVISDGTPEEIALMNQYYGEALTLRSLFYTELIRNWGDVPFKTEPTRPDGSNFFLPKTDRDIIYDRLIDDLKVAEDLVPWIQESADVTPERITKGFVKGLMARIALYRGGYSLRIDGQTKRGDNYLEYYQIANKQCAEIINKGIHKLNPSFINIFKIQCQREIDNVYNESLFEVGHGITRSGEAGYYIGVRFDLNPKYGRGTQGGVLTTPAYLYSFNPSDSRRLASVAFYRYDATPKQAIYSNPADFRINKWSVKLMKPDYWEMNRAASNKLLTGVNWCMMRYSDVLLMFAETENELNNHPTDSAKLALKEVRNRAFPDSAKVQMVEDYVNNLTTKEDFFKAIVDERAWEFGGEGIRKYDLVRWNLLGDKILEARELNKKIINREEPYDTIPQYLFYKYSETDPEDLDYTTLNLDLDLGSSDISGYTRFTWLSGLSDENKTSYINFLDLMSSGYNPATNRHLLPIAQTVIDDANNAFKNDYGY